MSKIKGKIKNIFSVILSVFLIFSFVVVGIAVYSKISGKQILPYKTVWVLTDSMEDTIQKESFILIKKVDTNEIKVGDVITFVSDDPTLKGNLNTHRVVEIKNGHTEFVTQGDNNVFTDNYTAKAKNVYGVYVKNLVVLTACGRFFSTKLGLVSVFSFVFICLIISMVVVNKKYKKIEIEKLVKEEVERLEKEYIEEHKQ